MQSNKYARPEMLVEPDFVARRLSDSRVRVIDMRSEAAYGARHIPGAVRLSDAPLRNPDERLTYLPRPEVFAELMGRAGVENRGEIVAYDDDGGRFATRLWYVASAFGFAKVRVLNGGWLKWAAQNQPVQTETPTVAPTKFSVKSVPDMTCPLPKLLGRKSGVVVLDARSEGEYVGKTVSGGSASAGRVPGSVNVDWVENLVGPYKEFKSASELRTLYDAKGVTPDKEIVVYCASGGRASHSLFALKLLGYKNVTVYYGSFADYSRLPDAPIEK